jgi:hypothetical protein
MAKFESDDRKRLAPIIGRGAARGQSIVEVLVAVSIVLVILSLGAGVSLRSHPGGTGVAARDIAAILADARALAATSGDGATVVIGPNQCSAAGSATQRATSMACLFSHRPISGSFSSSPARTIRLNADVEIPSLGTPPYGIFISPSGFVAAAQWSPSQGALTQEPVCTSTLTIVFDGSRNGVLDCVTASYSDASSQSAASPAAASEGESSIRS